MKSVIPPHDEDEHLDHKIVQFIVTPALFKRGDADGQNFDAESMVELWSVLLQQDISQSPTVELPRNREAFNEANQSMGNGYVLETVGPPRREAASQTTQDFTTQGAGLSHEQLDNSNVQDVRPPMTTHQSTAPKIPPRQSTAQTLASAAEMQGQASTKRIKQEKKENHISTSQKFKERWSR